MKMLNLFLVSPFFLAACIFQPSGANDEGIGDDEAGDEIGENTAFPESGLLTHVFPTSHSYLNKMVGGWGNTLLSKSVTEMTESEQTILKNWLLGEFHTYEWDDPYLGSGLSKDGGVGFVETPLTFYPCMGAFQSVTLTDPLELVETNDSGFVCGTVVSNSLEPNWEGWPLLVKPWSADEFSFCEIAKKVPLGISTGFISRLRESETDGYGDVDCSPSVLSEADAEIIVEVPHCIHGIWCNGVDWGCTCLCDQDNDCGYLDDLGGLGGEGQCATFPMQMVQSYGGVWEEQAHGCFWNNDVNNGVVPPFPTIGNVPLESNLECDDFGCSVSPAFVHGIEKAGILALAGIRYEITDNSIEILESKSFSLGAVAGISEGDSIVDMGYDVPEISGTEPGIIEKANKAYRELMTEGETHLVILSQGQKRSFVVRLSR